MGVRIVRAMEAHVPRLAVFPPRVWAEAVALTELRLDLAARGDEKVLAR